MNKKEQYASITEAIAAGYDWYNNNPDERYVYWYRVDNPFKRIHASDVLKAHCNDIKLLEALNMALEIEWEVEMEMRMKKAQHILNHPEDYGLVGNVPKEEQLPIPDFVKSLIIHKQQEHEAVNDGSSPGAGHEVG